MRTIVISAGVYEDTRTYVMIVANDFDLGKAVEGYNRYRKRKIDRSEGGLLDIDEWMVKRGLAKYHGYETVCENGSGFYYVARKKD
jgi:hypothetical protein